MKKILFVLIIPFIVFAQTELKYTVALSGGDATTVKGAVDLIKTNYPNLVTSDRYAIIEITGSWDTEDTLQPNFTSITTDASHYIKVITTGSARHSGKWSSSAHRLTSINNITVYISVDHVYFDGLQFTIKNPSATSYFTRSAALSSSDTTTFTNCIFKGHNNASHGQLFYAAATGSRSKIIAKNCILYNFGTNTNSYYNQTASTDSSYFYNCTFVFDGATAGVRRENGYLLMKNCYSANRGTRAYFGTIDTISCASDDGTGSPGYTNFALSNGNFIDTTEGSEDFRLPVGSALIDTGIDISADNVTDDIVGTSRPVGAKYDIGAYEYTASACSAPVITSKRFTMTVRDRDTVGHIATLNDLDSIKLIGDVPDSITMLSYDTYDSLIMYPLQKIDEQTITLRCYYCADSVDVIDTITWIWDSVKIDSVGIKSTGVKLTNADTVYWLDTLRYYGYWKGVRSIDSITIGDTACAVPDSSDTTLDVVIKNGITPGYIQFVIADTISADTSSNPDSVYLAGSRALPTISTQPASMTQMIGKTALYYSVVTGTGDLSFQWYKNSNTVSTDSVYSFTVAETDTNAELYVAVTDDNGTTNSSTAYLYTAIIDSVRPSYIRRDSTLTFYVRGKPDSTANTAAKLNALDMVLSAWSGDTVTVVIPADAPRGPYTKACLLNGSDTLAVSPNTIRVYVPEARARP